MPPRFFTAKTKYWRCRRELRVEYINRQRTVWFRLSFGTGPKKQNKRIWHHSDWSKQNQQTFSLAVVPLEEPGVRTTACLEGSLLTTKHVFTESFFFFFSNDFFLKLQHTLIARTPLLRQLPHCIYLHRRTKIVRPTGRSLPLPVPHGAQAYLSRPPTKKYIMVLNLNKGYIPIT